MMNIEDTLTNKEEPFQVVLIDLKKAAEGKIHCVEKPLMGSGDLNYVAISYRWGELHETLIDTGLGYVASITSFALKTLERLCKIMARERDLQSVDYVWIDAICVDQTNVERRKATIYHMTHIYERANYILAVPDLHLEYLLATNVINTEVLKITLYDGGYIYHLIQGNLPQLETYDRQFLDQCGVPNDPYLRHLLINYTDHFAKAFIKCRHNRMPDNEAEVLHHLLPTHLPVNHHHLGHGSQRLKEMGSDNPIIDLDKLTIDELHTCNHREACPLKHYPDIDNDDTCLNEYKKARIPERSQHIRKSMNLLTGLVKDWSTRAWVVSEFHIAKTKSNKMKYWFMHLDYNGAQPIHYDLDEYIFFEFDFMGPQLDDCIASDGVPYGQHDQKAVYQLFHATMQEQLIQQTFLEKMLKTKASKNVDRLHSILPSSEYKHILTSKEQVDRWNIMSLASVKLQLYEWMTTEHKLELLFLSACNESSYVLPTFATTTIHWPSQPDMYPTMQGCDFDGLPNFDLNNNNVITLTKDNSGSYKLNVKPLGYYAHENYRHVTVFGMEVDDEEEATVRRLLHLTPDDPLDYICIHDFADKGYRTQCILLLGSFIKNKWIIKRNVYDSQPIDTYEGFHHHSLDMNDKGFDIY